MNAMIQSLMFNDAFVSEILGFDASSDQQLMSFQNLIADLKYGITKSVDTCEFVESFSIKNNLQEDSSEFSTLFINWLDNAIIRHNQYTKGIRRFFEGIMENKIECTVCGCQSVSREKFLELRLDIPDDGSQGTVDLELLISQALAPRGELIEEFRCTNICNGALVSIIKTCQIVQLPEYLMVVLNRYRYSNERGREKISRPLRVSYELPQAGVCFGILEHVSDSAARGHYIAHMRQVGSSDWWTFDDTLVKPVLSEVTSKPNRGGTVWTMDYCESKSVYMILYDFRKKVIPSPRPTVEMHASVSARLEARNAVKISEYETRTFQRDSLIDAIRDRRRSLEKIIHELGNGLPSQWIPVNRDWLTKWSRADDLRNTIMTEEKFPEKCMHSKLSLLAVLKGDVRYIPLGEDGGGQSVAEMVCKDCVGEFKNLIINCSNFFQFFSEFITGDDDADEPTTVWIYPCDIPKVSSLKFLSCAESVIRRFISDTHQEATVAATIDLSNNILCEHGNVRSDYGNVLWRRSRGVIESLVSASREIPFVSLSCEKFFSCIDTSICSVCLASTDKRGEYLATISRVLDQRVEDRPEQYVIPLYWLQRVKKGIENGSTFVKLPELRFDSIICEHGLIRSCARYALACKSDMEIFISDEFRRYVCGLGKWTGESIPLFKTSQPCEECAIMVNQKRRNVNIRIIVGADESHRVFDDFGNVIWLKVPASRSRLVGTTDQLDLSKDIFGIKDTLVDMGIVSDSSHEGFTGEGIEVFVNHPNLRGALVELGSPIHGNVGNIDTMYVMVKNGDGQQPVVATKRHRGPTDKDAGLQGSILRDKGVEPIDLS